MSSILVLPRFQSPKVTTSIVLVLRQQYFHHNRNYSLQNHAVITLNDIRRKKIKNERIACYYANSNAELCAQLYQVTRSPPIRIPDSTEYDPRRPRLDNHVTARSKVQWQQYRNTENKKANCYIPMPRVTVAGKTVRWRLIVGMSPKPDTMNDERRMPNKHAKCHKPKNNANSTITTTSLLTT